MIPRHASVNTKSGGVLIWRISLRTFAALCVLCGKTPLKQLTAKSAKNANMTQRVELRTLPKICKCHLDKFRDHPGNTAARVRRGRGDSIQVADSEAPAKS